MKKRLMHLVSAASLIAISVYPLLHIAQCSVLNKLTLYLKQKK